MDCQRMDLYRQLAMFLFPKEWAKNKVVFIKHNMIKVICPHRVTNWEPYDQQQTGAYPCKSHSTYVIDKGASTEAIIVAAACDLKLFLEYKRCPVCGKIYIWEE